MGRLLKKTILGLCCLCAIGAEAKSMRDYKERLDSIVQMTIEGGRKTVFDYQTDSMCVTEKTYKAVNGGWQLYQTKVRQLDAAGRTIRLAIAVMAENGEEECVNVDFYYDAQGRNVETRWLRMGNHHIEDKGKRENVYGNDGSLIQYTTYEDNGDFSIPVSEVTFMYAPNVKVTSQTMKFWKDSVWTTHSHKEWIYDEKGRTSRVSEWMSKEGALQLHSKLEYNYNRKGVLKEVNYSREWSGSAKEVQKIQFLYDSKGNPVSEKHYISGKDGRKKTLSHTVRYRYYRVAPCTSIMGDAYVDNPYVILNQDSIPHGEYKLKEKCIIYSSGVQTWSKYYYSPIATVAWSPSDKQEEDVTPYEEREFLRSIHEEEKQRNPLANIDESAMIPSTSGAGL